MSSTLATSAYRRAVDRAHESLAAVRLSLAPSSPTAPTGADQGLRAALQGPVSYTHLTLPTKA